MELAILHCIEKILRLSNRFVMSVTTVVETGVFQELLLPHLQIPNQGLKPEKRIPVSYVKKQAAFTSTLVKWGQDLRVCLKIKPEVCGFTC